MALTVAFNGTNVTTADTTADWDNDTITAAEAWMVEVVHQGAGCIGFQASSKDGHGVYVMPTGSFNFVTTHLGQHVYIWINITMPGTIEALATGGLYLCVGSSVNDYKKFLISAKDYKEVMEKGFARYVLDPTKAATETVGTPDMTAVTVFGAWIDTDEAARIDQLFIDRIDVGFGLEISGTSTNLWEDIYAAEIDEVGGERVNMWGVVQKYNDVFYLYGQIKIKQGAAADTVISDAGKTVKFVSQQYYDGAAWVDMVSDSFFKIEFEDDASYATQFTDGILVGADAGRSGSSISGSLLHDTSFETVLLTNAASFLKMYSTQLVNFRGGIVYHDDVDSLFYGGTILGSGQFSSGAAVLRNMVFAETSDLDAALLWGSTIDIEKSQFIANTIGAAIEIPAAITADQTLIDLVFSGNTFDLYWKGLSGTLTVNNSGSSNAVSKETDGGTIYIPLATYSLSFTGIPSGVEYRLRQGSYTLQHEQDVVSGTTTPFSYEYTADFPVTVSFTGAGIIDSQTFSLPLSNADQIIPVVFKPNPSYIA